MLPGFEASGCIGFACTSFDLIWTRKQHNRRKASGGTSQRLTSPRHRGPLVSCPSALVVPRTALATPYARKPTTRNGVDIATQSVSSPPSLLIEMCAISLLQGLCPTLLSTFPPMPLPRIASVISFPAQDLGTRNAETDSQSIKHNHVKEAFSCPRPCTHHVPTRLEGISGINAVGDCR